MSVTSVNEIVGREYSADENMNRRDVRKYRIICDVANQSEPSICAQADMPAILAPHPDPVNFPGLRCTSVRIAQEEADNAFIWIATVSWGALTLGKRAAATSVNPEQRNQNPLLRPAILTFGSERFQRALLRDINGTDILNSAGDPFESGVMKDDFRPTFTITKNVATFDIPTWRDATNAINSSTFLGFDAETVRLVNYTGQEQYENGQDFFTAVGTFHVASDYEGDWNAHVLDCGYNEKVGGEFHPIEYQGGHLPGVTPRLNGAGVALTPGDASHYLTFYLYNRYDFNSLGFF
jgi:hypothetical protein